MTIQVMGAIGSRIGGVSSGTPNRIAAVAVRMTWLSEDPPFKELPRTKRKSCGCLYNA